MSKDLIILHNFDELDRTLRGLPGKITQNLQRKAMRKALRPLILKARSNIMGYSKTVGKSITINYTPRDEIAMFVGPKKSKKNDPWFAHFIEFGVSGIGRFKRKGRARYRADQPAKPFMRPAFDTTKNEVVKLYGDAIGQVTADYFRKNFR